MSTMRNIVSTSQRFIVAAAMICVFAAAANAYTVVMRGGHRIEIPDNFTVTSTTLTYPVAADIQVTVQLAAIDIPATEKANGEASGSFSKRGQQMASDQVSSVSKTTQRTEPARRSITNRELARFARVREKSEISYNRRLKQLGLPSLAESRRRAAAEAKLISDELAERRAQDAETESYWRERASELRTEIAAVDAEISFVRTRLDEIPRYFAGGSYTVVSTAFQLNGGRAFGHGGQGHFPRRSNIGGINSGFAQFGFGLPTLSPNLHRPGVFVAPRNATPLTARVGFHGGPNRPRGFGVSLGFGRSRGLVVAPPFLPFGSVTGFSAPFEPYDVGYERAALITRLNELVGTRAALNARWRELENEARRAGAPPGWLRP